MKTCPACNSQYEDGIVFCPLDGTPLHTTKRALSRVGSVISNKYRVIDKLGAGGMGSVYLAEQINLGGRRVALKLLQQQLASDLDALERFKNEAFTVGQLSHPNIVIIYEMEQTQDGELYIAMEYLQGISLRKLLDRESCLPPVRTLSICKLVARALGEAHRKGIIHRDVKPDNIMVQESEEGEDQVKVLDFGIAKLKEGASSKTQTGMVLGTPRYMSFEQASGMSSSQLDARSDIYSLGVVMYEMLTGRAPFDAETPMGTLLKHLKEEPPTLRMLRPDLGLPEELETTVMRCLSKDRERRHTSARELALELEKLEIRLRSQAQVPAYPAAAAEPQKTTLISEDLLKMASLAAQQSGQLRAPEPRAVPPQPVKSAPPAPAARTKAPAISKPPVGEPRGGTSPLVWVGLAAILLLAVGGGYWYLSSSGPTAPAPAPAAAGGTAAKAGDSPSGGGAALSDSGSGSVSEVRPGGNSVPPESRPAGEGDSGKVDWQLAEKGQPAGSRTASGPSRPPVSQPPPAAATKETNRRPESAAMPVEAGRSGKAAAPPRDVPAAAVSAEPSNQARGQGGFPQLPPMPAGSAVLPGAAGFAAGGKATPVQPPAVGQPPAAQFPTFSEPDQPKNSRKSAVLVEAPGASTSAPAASVTGVPAAGAPAASEPGAGNADVLISAGQAQLQRQDFAAAASSFAAADRLRPDSAEALEGLAKACESSGRVGEALKARKRLVELRPDSGPAHSMLANLYALQGDAASATLEHRKAMQYANETWFLVQHGHDPAFGSYCAGQLFVRPGGVEFNAQDTAHKIKLPKGAFKDVDQFSNGFRAQTKSKNPISFRFASQKSQEMAVFFRLLAEVLR